MRVPSYRKHSSGNARVSINGRDYLLGKYGTKQSKERYHRLLSEWMASHCSKSFGIPVAQLTVSQLLAEYVGHLKKYYKGDAARELYKVKPALSAMRSLYGSTPAESIGPLQFRAVREHLSRTGDRSRTHVNSVCIQLKRMLKWAASQSLIPASNAEAVRMVEPLKLGRTNLRETEAVKPVPDETVEATLPFLSQVVADMVRFQLATGCRPGEVCSIQPGMVNRAGEVWEIHLTHHKTAHRGKKRVIYVPKPAQEILAKYLDRRADAFCFNPKEVRRQMIKERSAARVTPLSCGNKPGSNRGFVFMTPPLILLTLR